MKSRIRQRIGGLLAGAVLAGGLSVASAPPAAAGDCALWVLCGKVQNSSSKVIQISNAWHDYPGSPALVNPADKHTLYPGHNSWEYANWKDTDAYWFPAPCIFRKYTGSRGAYADLPGNYWRKLGDLDVVNVILRNC